MPALAEEVEAAQPENTEIKYSIDVDIINQIVTVYHAGLEQNEENIVRQMICSTGYGNSTPRGTFEMCPPKYEVERQEWYYFTEYEVWAKYASRIQGNYLFHSILYPNKKSGPTWASSSALGSKASHGCVRLRVDDAKWVAENCPPGTMVYIHEDNERTPEFEDLREILLSVSFSADETSYADFLKGYIPISKGSRYSKVNDLQEMLNALGFDCGSADGIFGSATERAVMAWQEANGHEADGIVSPEQLEEILTSEIPEPTATPAPTAEPTPEPTAEPAAEPTATIEPTAKPSPVPQGTIARVQVREGSHLLLRINPDRQAMVLASLPGGTELTVICQEDEWTRVRCNEGTGWVSNDYIAFKDSAQPDSTLTPEPTVEPTTEPTAKPTTEPTAKPTVKPTSYADIIQALGIEDLAE